MAKLPQELLAKPEPELRSIGVGQTVYVEKAAMFVAPDLSCYLYPESPCRQEKTPLKVLRVRRDEVGFHVTIMGPWTWRPVEPEASLEAYIPVATISVERDPLWEPRQRTSSAAPDKQEAVDEGDCFEVESELNSLSAKSGALRAQIAELEANAAASSKRSRRPGDASAEPPAR